MSGGVAPTCVAHCPYFRGPQGHSTLVRSQWLTKHKGVAEPIAEPSTRAVARTYLAVGTLSHGVLLVHASFAIVQNKLPPRPGQEDEMELRAEFCVVSALSTSLAGTRAFPVVKLACYCEYAAEVATIYREQGMRQPLLLLATAFEQRSLLVWDLHSPSSSALAIAPVAKLPLCNFALYPDHIYNVDAPTSTSVAVRPLSNYLQTKKLASSKHLESWGMPRLIAKGTARCFAGEGHRNARVRHVVMLATESGKLVLLAEKTLRFVPCFRWVYDCEPTTTCVASDGVAEAMPQKSARRDDAMEAARRLPLLHERGIIDAELVQPSFSPWSSASAAVSDMNSRHLFNTMCAVVLSHGTLLHVLNISTKELFA